MYKIVKKPNWTIRGPDNQPAPGFKLTLLDDETGDSFDLEVPSLNPDDVARRVQAAIDQRRGVDQLSFG